MFKMTFSLFFLTLMLNSKQIYASQLTTVINSQAIIYADRQLSTPIGFLRAGKKVRVGIGLKRGGKVLPLIVEGKVTYIKVEDLALRDEYLGASSGLHKVQHDTESQFSIPEDNLSKNIFLIGSYTSLSSNLVKTQVGQESSIGANNDEYIANFLEYTLYIEHRQPFGRFSWGVGVGFLQSATTGEDLQSILGRGSFAGSFFRSQYFSLQAAFEPFFSGDVDLGTVPTSDSETPEEKLVGLLYGYRASLQARILPHNKYGGVLGIGVEKSYIRQTSSTELVNDYALDLTSNVFYAALSYKF